MKLKYFIGGASHAASLIDAPPSGKRVAVRHNNANYYAGLVQHDDESASLLNIFFDGGNYAIATASSVPNYYYYKFNANSSAVTVNSNFGDFGVFSKGETSPATTSGSEYYSALFSITAAQDNSTLIGNKQNNTFILSGGANNVLVGGIGKDTYNFNNGGGGVITDYGIGSTKKGDGTALVSLTSAANYNRTDSTSYTNETDVIKVKGTFTGIYFDNYNNSKNTPSFTAVLTYNDNSGNEHIIVLKINKKPTSTGNSPIYTTNDNTVSTFKLWDTSGGSQSVLNATKLRNLKKADTLLSAAQQAQVDYLLSLNPF